MFLAAEQVVSQQLLDSLLNIARFRNLIVHDYAKIDDVKCLRILKHRLGDFDAFAEAIRIYLIGSIEARCPHYILDARTATPHFPGIGRYVTNLARALVPLLADDERLTVICDPTHPDPAAASDAARTIPLAVSPFSLRQQWIIPRLLRSLRMTADADTTKDEHPASSVLRPSSVIYHSPYIAMPYWPGIPSLLTVYDLIPVRYPAYSSPRARFFIRWMTRLALRAARHVIAISEFTRRDFMAEFGLRPEQITAIPLAADPAFQPQPPEAIAAVRARYDLPERLRALPGQQQAAQEPDAAGGGVANGK